MTKTIPNQKNFNKKMPLSIAVLTPTPSNPVFFKLPFFRKGQRRRRRRSGALGDAVFCAPFFQVIFVA